MPDVMDIEILDDGTVKITTDKVSGANHRTAEAFLAELARSLGGKTEVRHKHGAHGHLHQHSHGHSHES